MNHRRTYLRALVAFIAMILLMLNTDIAATGVAAGIDLCIRVVIPSLFPFFIISSWLNSSIQGISIPGLRLLGNFLHLNSGSEGIFLIGLLGGYPVGAQCIADAKQQGQLDTMHAQRMLGFCSNAGPAFIFGITRLLFVAKYTPWIIWLIHICSAIFVGIILPPVPSKPPFNIQPQPISFTNAMKQSIHTTISVCSWIILFKTILQFLTAITSKYPFLSLTIGLLELSNGTLQLNNIPQESMRFILCSSYLGFGGLCVWMQTHSVSGTCGTGLYLPGKVMQLLISASLSALISMFLFQENIIPPLYFLLMSTVSIFLIIMIRHHCTKKLWKLTQI